jgi:outer membrane protein OmpA-like peptidoglycan-associated protein
LEPESVLTLNTEGDELFPFVSTTGDLYFASNGYGGLGGLDLYKTVINSPGGLIYNMGYPVNTSYDDFALALDETGKKGYISSNRKNGMGGDDIYELTIYKIRVESKLIDKETAMPVVGKIRIMDERTGQEVPYELAGDKIVFDALKGRLYKIIVEDERYASQEIDVDTKTDKRFISMEIPVTSNKVEAVVVKEGTETSAESVVVQFSNLSKTIAFRVMPGAVRPEEINAADSANGAAFIEIKDIYFAFNSDEILSGQEDLKKLVDVLNKFQSVDLEVTAYSDVYGTAAYNDDLSDRRGNKVINYLTAQGVDKSRIKLRVVGSRELFNTCPHPEECSKDEHRQNRRVEFNLAVIK